MDKKLFILFKMKELTVQDYFHAPAYEEKHPLAYMRVRLFVYSARDLSLLLRNETVFIKINIRFKLSFNFFSDLP